MFEFKNEIDLQYLANTSNGSPGKMLENITIWEEIPEEIKNYLEIPINDNLKILKISKFLTEKLENNQQIILINLIQYKWWRKTKNKKIVQELETLKSI